MQIETGFLCEIGCGDGARVIRLVARVIQQLDFDSENSSQRRLLLRLAPRRDAPSTLRSVLDSSILR